MFGKDIFEYKDCISRIQSVNSIKIFGVDNTNSSPDFTIAVPTYRRSSILKETVESAINQHYEGKYVVIVVDNNPERGDETEIMMTQYKNHPMISYYKNSENLGMAGNWNKCLLLSYSNRVILLHDDDIISPFLLQSFSLSYTYLKENWCMVKPNMIKFNKRTDMQFGFPKRLCLIRLRPDNFFHGCSIGAPTGILLNRDVILKTGGYDQEVFPCFDYEMCVKLVGDNSLYTLSGNVPLGGYRVSCNESISEITMDMFYKTSYRIGDSLMKQMGIPRIVQRFIHSFKNDATVKCLNDYYEMPNYQFKNEVYPILKMPQFFKNIFLLVDNFYYRIVGFLRRKLIYIDKM